ncbi:helix-turn-helix transcriptional regulator [Aliarcobacter butzleri]|uniref:helix-turn-helix transcriptional regulator n=1 Tax=Aliarcobacter butzleri TaxID=28197 RepID=UPI0021B60918|nr:hypothetical protein [Aliarcobacter butzleri]MCT7637033.1 hypothetical protein [Aliarcobacter butzleri]
MTKKALLNSFYDFDAFFNINFFDINPKDEKKVKMLIEQLASANAEYILFKRDIEEFCKNKKKKGIKVVDKPVGDFARAPQLSKLLGIGLSTVWLYAKQGKITPIKLSHRVTVFNVKAVKKALQIA